MRKSIIVGTKAGPQARLRAIVRGDLALHVALRNDGQVLNEWAVTYVPTGQQIIVVRGAHAGRFAFCLLTRLSFTTIDERLMQRCNAVVTKLRKRHLTVLFPRRRFGSISEV